MKWTWPWILPIVALAIFFVGTVSISITSAWQGRKPNAAQSRYYRRLRYKILVLGLAMMALGVFGLIEQLRVPAALYMLYCGALLGLMGPVIALEVATRDWGEATLGVPHSSSAR